MLNLYLSSHSVKQEKETNARWLEGFFNNTYLMLTGAVVYQETPKDRTDALNSFSDLVLLKFNRQAAQKRLAPYVTMVR